MGAREHIIQEHGNSESNKTGNHAYTGTTENKK